MVTGYTDNWVKIGKIDTYGEVLELLGTPTGDVIEKPVTPVDPENPNNPNKPSDNNGNNNGNSAGTTDKKNTKNPLIPKTGGEGTTYAMMAVCFVLALAIIGAAIVIYKKKKRDCAEK